MVEVLRNFDIAHEEARVQKELSNISSYESYRKRRDALISYNTDQMITNLGERFNVLLSNYEYDIKDGQLWGKDMDEPAIDSFVRGRDYRREHGKQVDFGREEAEVIGFKKIQDIMTDETTPEGTIMMSVSRPGRAGSTYEHNFIDFHTKKTGKDGRVYMESQRVSSGLTESETLDKISAFAKLDIDENDVAASLLEQPVMITEGLSIEDVRFYLYRDHDYMDERAFEVIKNSVSHLTAEYAKSLVVRPDDRNYHRILFNTILNKADEVAEGIKIDGIDLWRNRIPISTEYYVKQEIENYGYNEVKEIRAGCGVSGGFDIELTESPLSVSEYGTKKDKYGERSFKCPACNKENVRPHNKLLSHCQHCRSTEVAC